MKKAPVQQRRGIDIPAFRRLPSLLCGIVFASGASAQSPADSSSPSPNPLETVVISATRSERQGITLPTPVRVLGEPAIRMTPASTVQDLLRSIPGFSTRDYQSGLMTGPSQSIVTFRGLGGSSAGRALVLLDGIPIGDPFSGWLDWGRIPLSMLSSAEVIRGGGSVIWGSRALAGVVNLRTVTPTSDGASLLLEGGSFSTFRAAALTRLKRRRVSAVAATDYLDTDGFVLLPSHQAGPVDKPQSGRSQVFSARINYDVTESMQTWIGGSLFDGGDFPRAGGDHEHFDEMRAGVRWLGASKGVMTASAFANRRLARSESFTINSDRTTSTPQRAGRSPAHSQGMSLQWTRTFEENHEISAGADLTAASGSLTEKSAFVDGVPTSERRAGGSQQFAGVFLQDAAELGGGLKLLASLRLDHFRSTDGGRVVRSLPLRTVVSDSTIADKGDMSLTYSVGLRKQQSRWLGLRASAYEAFRAPSMYEMYHPRFSSRGTVTEANAQLAAERLRGLEGGLDLSAGRSAIVRLTGFTNRVESPIMDITIATAGSTAEVIPPCGLMPARQTCSQRQNVPALRSNGLEAEFAWQPSRVWKLDAGYSYNSTRVRAPGEPVDGKRALRSPPRTIVSSVAFNHPRWFSAAVEGRYVSERFEDDRNTIELDDFYLVGLRLNRALGRRLAVHLKVENLLDEEFEIARSGSGIAEMGARRWVTAGLRAQW